MEPSRIRSRRAGTGRRRSLALLLALALLAGFPAARAEAGAAKKAGAAGQRDPFKGRPMLLFRVALRFHQRGLYARSLPLLQRFVKEFSNHSSHQRAVYLLADAHFFIAKTGVAAAYTSSTEMYLLALSLYPDAPQMPSSYFRLAQSYQAQSKPAEAQVAYRTLLEKAPLSPQAPRAQLEVAKRYVQLNDPRNAIVEFNKVLDKYKGTPSEKEAFFGVATAFFQQQLYRGALKRFETGLKRWPDFVNLRPQLLFSYAETLFQVRRFSEAGKVYLRMINIFPKSDSVHRALARLGDIYLEAGRRRDALSVYFRVTQEHPRTEGALISLIRMADMGVEGKEKIPKGVVFGFEPFQNPLETYRKVIKKAPASRLAEVAYLRIATYHLKKGFIRKTADTVQEFLKAYPASPLKNNAHLILAHAFFGKVNRHFQRRQFLRAVQTYADFRSRVPLQVSRLAKPYKVMLQVGESYMRMGLYPQAIKVLGEIMDEPEGVLAVGEEVMFRLTQSNLLLGERLKAKSLGLRFAKRFPRSRWMPSISALLGEIAWLEVRARDSVAYLSSALDGELDLETRGRSLFLLAEASAAIGRYDAGVEALRKAIVLDPKMSGRLKPFSLEQATYRLGDILFEGRRWVSSLLSYRRALQLFPESPQSGWAYHRIARIQDELRLAGRVTRPARPLAESVSDPFWKDVSQSREKSLDWDRQNRAKVEELLREKARN